MPPQPAQGAARRHGLLETPPPERRRHLDDIVGGAASSVRRGAAPREDQLAGVLRVESQRQAILEMEDDDVLAGSGSRADLAALTAASGDGYRVLQRRPAARGARRRRRRAFCSRLDTLGR